MAVGTALLAGLLGKYGYIANQTQNATVLSIMKHAFTTIPGVLWIVTAVVLFFYRLNKKRYNEIEEELKLRVYGCTAEVPTTPAPTNIWAVW